MLSTLRLPFRWALSLRRSADAHEPTAEHRFAVLASEHLDAVYRTARRLGARDGDLEDLVQEVLVVLARRLDDIEPGKERAFVLGTAARVASEFRRRECRRREELMAELDPDGGCPHLPALATAASGERQVEQSEALELLRAGLEAMTEPQRSWSAPATALARPSACRATWRCWSSMAFRPCSTRKRQPSASA